MTKPATATVYVVFCIDTEGPCLDRENPDLLGTWDQVDRAMDKLFETSFRRSLTDSRGGRFKVGWFFLTWTGFVTNPRERDFGYHKVRDRYLARWGAALREFGDEECWHYHHPSRSGVGNEWGLDWAESQEYEQIISRQILERSWFPACFRAGGTIMSPESSRWIDSWFPIDYSSRAPLNLPGIVDWRGGVTTWHPYHPDVEDFRHPGAGRRKMVRCLDLMTGAYVLDDAEIVKAFDGAAAGRSQILAVFDHDYRDIRHRVVDLHTRLQQIAARYPAVSWEYAGPVEAVRLHAGAPPQPRLEIEVLGNHDTVTIWTTAPIFQAFPWVAARTSDGKVHHVVEGILAAGPDRWTWRPPQGFEWRELAVAASTHHGVATVSRRFCAEATPGASVEQATREHPNHPRSIWEHSSNFYRSCVLRTQGALPEMDSVRQATEILAERMKPGMTVLDVGCAGGHASRALLRLGFDYFGIDSYRSGIEVGRHELSGIGVRGDRLRALAIEDLSASERYDAVLCLNVLGYFPSHHLPLEIMARAARRWLVIRGAFGGTTTIRYLPDVLLDPGFQTMRAYFAIFGRAEVEAFLGDEGFDVVWVPDRRQLTKFGDCPEVVGGVALPAEFLVAERVRPIPEDTRILGPALARAADEWRTERKGGPNW